MAKKDRYNYSSPVAAGLGLAVTGAASMIPATTTIAGPLGTITTGIFGGVDLTNEEKNIKHKFDEAINETWQQIYDDYKLTDVCFSTLKQEVIGENTSTDEFVDNSQRKKLEESYALVIQFILEKYRGGLERKSKKTWDDEYIKNASKDIAARLIFTLQNVFSEDDLLKILKAISDRSNDIRGDIGKNREANRLEHEQLMQILIEISELIKSKRESLDAPPALTTIPIPPDMLIGREKAIEEIQNLSAQHKTVSIHADGGVGKTAVAAKIVNQIKDEIVNGKSLYKHVAWITSTGDLKSDLTGLNIPLMDTVKTQEEKYQIVSTYLQSKPTFLVIDNMDEPPTREDLNELNTISGQTKELITTRAYIPFVKEYLLGDLDPDSALILFYWHYLRKEMTIEQIKDQKDCSYVASIIKAATYNSLFIELISKMAYADHWKLDSLWEKLNVDVFGVDSKHSIRTINGDGRLLDHIQKLYEMSGLSEKQKEIMSFMALFPAEYSIFFDVFEWAGFEDDENDNLGELQDRGWIERDDEGYLIHTIVKGSIEKQGDILFDESRYERLIDALAETDQYIPLEIGVSKVRERIVVADTICRLLLDKEKSSHKIETLFNSLASAYYALGEYKKSLKYSNEVLDIQNKKPIKDLSTTFMAYNNLTVVYIDQGNYEKALECSNKARIISEEVLGKNHPFTATVYNNRAEVLYAKGNYKGALKYYKRALTIQEAVLGKEDLSTARTYINMGSVYRLQKQFREALNCYENALETLENTLGRDHPTTATTYNNMGAVYEAQGNHEKALEYYERALELQEDVLGKNHPVTASIYNNIAEVFTAQGNYEKALDYYNKALKILEELVGKEHPNIATTYGNIAGLYSDKGEYEKALKLYEKALAIQEKVLGNNHFSMAMTYGNISEVYIKKRDYKTALVYARRALPVLERTLGSMNPYTVNLKNSIDYLQVLSDK